MKLGMCKDVTVANMYTQKEVVTSIYSCSVNRDVCPQQSEYSRDD